MDEEQYTHLTHVIEKASLEDALHLIVYELKSHLTAIDSTFRYIDIEQYSELDQKYFAIGRRGLIRTSAVIDKLLLGQFLPRLQQLDAAEEE